MTAIERATLIDGPVGRTLARLTGPMILGIVAMIAFNLTDTFFVSRLGTLPLAALSFTMPVVYAINHIIMGIGIGASAAVSRAVGSGDIEEARRLTMASLSLALVFTAVFVVTGFLFSGSLFQLLGADAVTMPLIDRYMRIWFAGVLFLVFPMVGNNIIRALGDTKIPAAIMVIAVVLNIILDPLLIFGIGPFPRMELAGAALTTVLSRSVTMAVAILVLWRRYRMITFRGLDPGRLLCCWRSILFVGLPAAATKAIIPAALGVITRVIARFGPAAVAGYGVAMRVEFFALAVVMALSSVIGPFVGQNWGAGRRDRAERSIFLSTRFALAWGLGMLALLALPARWIAGIFSDNPAVVDTIVLYLRIVPLCYGLEGVFVIAGAALNVIRRPIHAAALALVQMFALAVPLALLGRRLLGVGGIFGGITAAYLLAGLVAWLVLRRSLDQVSWDRPPRGQMEIADMEAP
ncbi:MAG: MATE family efflux transporter [Candidatus Krumholzibacteriota bacterium]|nr:MATE family efflux transporter [Candidatus Krumholzibacteriota bacterium]